MVALLNATSQMEEFGSHITFTIADETGGPAKQAAPTHGTIIGYIVQTNFKDEGISLSWYDSGSTPNIVIGIIPTKYATNKLTPAINGVVNNAIHRTYAVTKLKLD